MKPRQFRLYAAPGFTVRHVVAAILDQGWPQAANVYGEMSLRKRKGWREVRFNISAETQKRNHDIVDSFK